MGKATKSLLVCATPRSGSTLLCALLDGTDVVGRPQDVFERLSSGLPRQPREYFEGVDDAELLELLASTAPGEPDDATRSRRRSPTIPGARSEGSSTGSARWVERARAEVPA